jgi:hypothetical protein
MIVPETPDSFFLTAGLLSNTHWLGLVVNTAELPRKASDFHNL